MGHRRNARELAMQALFFMDMRKKNTEEESLELYCLNFKGDFTRDSRLFFDILVDGVREHRDDADSLIEQHSSNWKVSRMSCVDRNIMRIAVYELIYCSDIPPKVTINEAIDIGKKFGSKESGPFINGILDSIRLSSHVEESDSGSA